MPRLARGGNGTARGATRPTRTAATRTTTATAEPCVSPAIAVEHLRKTLLTQTLPDRAARSASSKTKPRRSPSRRPSSPPPRPRPPPAAPLALPTALCFRRRPRRRQPSRPDPLRSSPGPPCARRAPSPARAGAQRRTRLPAPRPTPSALGGVFLAHERADAALFTPSTSPAPLRPSRMQTLRPSAFNGLAPSPLIPVILHPRPAKRAREEPKTDEDDGQQRGVPRLRRWFGWLFGG